MNKIILMIVFLIALSASGIMYFSEKASDLPQLSDYFWIPLPLAFVALIFLVFNRRAH